MKTRYQNSWQAWYTFDRIQCFHTGTVILRFLKAYLCWLDKVLNTTQFSTAWSFLDLPNHLRFEIGF